MHGAQDRVRVVSRESSRRHLLAAYLFCSPLLGLGCTPGSVADQKQSLLAIYMPGCNLEDRVLVRGSWITDEDGVLPKGQPSPFGAASADLREVVAGIRGLPPAARPRLSVWVAFGGALKQGWSGVRYADGSCLVDDAQDGRFGNATCYAFADDQADMSSPDALEKFARFVSNRAGRNGTKVLDLWGQGAAYRGLLYDSVKQEIPLTPLRLLAEALARAGARFELLIMDASLMASLEVADIFATRAQYLAASADIVPGHGLDYQALVARLGNGKPTGYQIGKQVIDDFIDGQSAAVDQKSQVEPVLHRKTRGKTAALLQLDKARPLLRQLDAVVSKAMGEPEGTSRMLAAFAAARRYAPNRKTGESLTVELFDVARSIGSFPAVVAEAASLLSGLRELMPYARADRDEEIARGIAIFNPLSARIAREHYGPGSFLSPVWRAFLRADGISQEASVRRPRVEISDEQEGWIAAAAIDPSGIIEMQDVWGERVQRTGETLVWSRHAIAGSSQRRDGQGVRVRLAPWDGRVIWLCDGSCATGKKIPVPISPLGPRRLESNLYSGAALVRTTSRPDLEAQEALVFVELDEHGRVRDHWVTSIESDTNDDPLYSKDQYVLGPGLTVSFRFPCRRRPRPSRDGCPRRPSTSSGRSPGSCGRSRRASRTSVQLLSLRNIAGITLAPLTRLTTKRHQNRRLGPD